MAGIYLHIPFCRQACHYCDFHFSTNTNLQPQMIEAMALEVALQRTYLNGEKVGTIYFGGGTPSLLPTAALELLLNAIRDSHAVADDSEITLEANPDDITPDKLREWKHAGINRLSIGIQTFDDALLKYLNRIHTSATATASVDLARNAGFENFSIDLMYAIPGLSAVAWEENIGQAVRMSPPHISAYTLTIEEKTVFGNWHARGRLKPVDEGAAAVQLEALMQLLPAAGYTQYEISNFAMAGFASRHNSSYWKGASYLGIGPSAHSYNQLSRQYNVANNHLYIRALDEGRIPAEVEVLTNSDHINEYILTSLRTDRGCDLSRLKRDMGYDLLQDRGAYLSDLQQHDLISQEGSALKLTHRGKLVADRISSDLFIVD